MQAEKIIYKNMSNLLRISSMLKISCDCDNPGKATKVFLKPQRNS